MQTIIIFFLYFVLYVHDVIKVVYLFEYISHQLIHELSVIHLLFVKFI